MKTVLLIATIFMLSVQLSAQRLFVQDIVNGNYKSFDVGDKVELILLDSIKNVSGKITALQLDALVLNDTVLIKLSQIVGLVKNASAGGSGFSVGKVLLIVLGSYMMVVGTIYVITGAALVAYDEPQLGVVIFAAGAGIGVGGYAIVKRQLKRARSKTPVFILNDNIHYRLFIE